MASAQTEKPRTTLLHNARLWDGLADTALENASLLIEGGVVREVGVDLTGAGDARRIDCEGLFVMPGLIDAHYHANTPSYDFYGTDRMHPALLASHASRLLTGALDRGYTTVRDAGGGDIGLAQSLEAGLIDGPRFFYPGKALTQTGGHGDMRRRGEPDLCGCGAYSGVICEAVDGPQEMRKAVRQRFRQGATHIKIFLSGGVSTDLAPLEMPHFTDAEIAVAVEEAARRGSYVMAHCHTDAGARRCVALGVRTIEHGSLIEPETAVQIAKAGVFVVPTLSAGALIAENATQLGLPLSAAEKVKAVNAQTLRTVQTLEEAGVKMGLGCDLHGDAFLQTQGRELYFRGQVQRPVDVLRSATSINAEIVQRAGTLGQLTPGAAADLIMIEGDPLTDLSVFVESARTVRLAMIAGEVRRDRRGEPRLF
ncbi:MAG: amidohydrolase family protein [Pseudomonadota bacterium]